MSAVYSRSHRRHQWYPVEAKGHRPARPSRPSNGQVPLSVFQAHPSLNSTSFLCYKFLDYPQPKKTSHPFDRTEPTDGQILKAALQSCGDGAVKSFRCPRHNELAPGRWSVPGLDLAERLL